MGLTVLACGCWVVPVALVVVGLQANRTATQPRQEQVRLVADVDSGAARWQTSGRSGWGADLAASDVPALQAPGPEVQVVDDRAMDGRRTLVLRLSSPRSAPMMTLDTGPGTRVEQVRLEGRELPVDEGPARVPLTGVPGEGANIEVVLSGTGPVHLVLADHTTDLAGFPQASPPDGWVVTDPRITLTRTVTV